MQLIKRIFLPSILIVFLSTSFLFGREGTPSHLRFQISFAKSIHATPITGRVYVVISKTNNREPRTQISRRGTPFFGLDIGNLKPGSPVTIDEHTLGSPVESLTEIPEGDYFVQCIVNIYTQFKRADGHTVWLHKDRWEGQRFNISPGNLYSPAVKIHLDHKKGYNFKLIATRKIPPIKKIPDTKWVKRIKIRSKLLSDFWGQPMYLGATILLPRGYEDHPAIYYPVDYIQGHFSTRSPYGFTGEPPQGKSRWGKRGFDFYQAWISDNFPRMILVTFQHPCPYFDDSYAVNSVNCGPYGDAILTELIPEIETRFRVIRQPYARILEGGSTGGWETLALQIFHPDFFGGAFGYCPDPLDFSDVEGINIYKDKNAYYKVNNWVRTPTISVRNPDGSIQISAKQKNYYELVRGTKGRSGEQFDIWSAVYGPVGDDGYFKPLYDKVSGKIDSTVAFYWQEHFDLRYYLEQNWSWIGAKLVGKLHVFTGDMDTFYLNNGVHLFEAFLKKTKNPHYEGFFWYAPRKPHCWAGPFTSAERIKFFAVYIAKNTPRNVETLWWNY